ncbi:GNAT family N-acetyltransferase [Janibacter sp. G56]|uniref:bifunctional acetate--CoA ligase family protein/GNAT family N-acetyltransferase n=1 Tax=Janibacter sp. G56 TaxID=3418717 RepID=UPI003D05C84D
MTDTGLPPGYLRNAEADVVLRDGSVAHLRPIVPGDADRLSRFHERQSEESVYLRFFAPMRRLSAKDLHRFTHVDYVDRVALVATMQDDIIGIGRYDRVTPTSAEVAFNISDHYQGKGIGSVMLEHLAAIAQEGGITRFEAEVLPQNRKMLAVFSDAGYEVSRRLEDGVVMVHFDIEPTEQSQSVRFAREHRAEAVSMTSLLNPKEIAVVGASRRPQAVGHQVLRNILDARFPGAVHAVNREALEVLGLEAHTRVSEIPAQIDLAVVCVPAPEVLEVVSDCAAAGVRSLLVISSGFAESGAEGERLQADLLRLARGNGMRVVGPNSFGIINNEPQARLNASLAPMLPPPGPLGLFSQSGALAIAVLESAARRNLGISVFASAGNRVDVSGNDLMQYWIDDESTRAVGLYLESMGNPRKFSRIARNLAAIKPVIVVKSRVTSYGTPPGHRVRATRVRPEAFDAMLRQAGVVRVDNVHQMFDVAQLVLNQPLPRGRRVAIVGNSSQLSALSADAATSAGLDVTHGPVSVPPEASAEKFRRALDAAFTDEDVDSVIACFIPPVGAVDRDVVEAVRGAAAASDKPCVATLLGLRGVDGGRGKSVYGGPAVLPEHADEGPDGEAIPLYAMPEDAVRALAAATNYGVWRDKDRGLTVAPDGIDRKGARRLIEGILAEYPEGRALTSDESHALLACYGIDLWPRIEVADVDEAVAAAEQLGYPVVLKSLSPLVRGQSVLDGVRVDLNGEAALRAAYEVLDRRLAPLDANYLVVQGMATPGVPCVVSSDEDPLFGPVLSFSVAGTATELIEDIGYRIPPLTDVDVRELMDSIKLSPLLNGHRGAQPVDKRALGDVIARLSVLTEETLELSSLVLNPVMAHHEGADVLGAEIVISPAHRRTDPGRRSLT